MMKSNVDPIFSKPLFFRGVPVSPCYFNKGRTDMTDVWICFRNKQKIGQNASCIEKPFKSKVQFILKANNSNKCEQKLYVLLPLHQLISKYFS